MPAPRVVVHFGFHKTGTSTIEHTLLNNAALLAPHLKAIGNAQLGDAIGAAKMYSTRRNPRSLARFAERWSEALALAPLAEGQALCISCVDLVGRVPGHPQIHDYAAAPQLVKAMKAGVVARFGAGVDLQFVASTRAPAAWLKSLWAQNLKVHRIIEDQAAFAARFEAIADLAAQAKALVPAAAPYPMHSAPLEIGKTHALGPAGPILDMFELPSHIVSQIKPQKPLKVSFPDDALAVLLDINRSDLDDAALKETKAQAMQVFKAGFID